MNKRHLILTGFMGTGKSTVGQHVAEQLGLPFCDMDELVVERTGHSINDLFATLSEAGFRAWEAAIAHELGASVEPQVIATGGGTFLNPANRDAFRDATIICLTAQPEAIYHRLKDDQSRPLLQGDDPQKQIADLLAQRWPLYESFRWQIDTSFLSVEEIAADVRLIWEREQVIREHEERVLSPEGSYPLLIDEGLLERLPDILDVYGLAERRTAIITDSRVVKHYGEKLVGLLPNSFLTVMPAGESYKHLDTVARLLNEVARNHLDRKGIVIALGGGVVGDTAGFVAATYMRGVRLVQIPTTLLAMVDASVGGKVGVDIPLGKNLVGAFKQPDMVLVDPTVLETLPDEDYRSGVAEIIKHGLIANPALLEDTLPLTERIKAAIQVKIDVVQRDPYEKYERMFLNLGHTFAHAIEQVSGYSWRHGDAVAVGLVGAAMLSHRLQLLNQETVEVIEATVAAAGLPRRYQYFSAEALWQAMTRDKKWRDGRSHFVVLQGIGQPAIVSDVDKSLVIGILERLRAS